MDDAPDRSPRRQQLQGQRPPRLAVSKNSHKIEKPAVSRNLHQTWRASVIIYDAAMARPGGFKALFQRLTGPVVAAAAAPVYMDDLEGPSPAARLAAIERAQPQPDRRPGILSPALLPPAASLCSWWQPSALPFNPSSGLPSLAELFPFLATTSAATRVQELGPWDPFALASPNITMPLRPLSAPMLEFLTANAFPDLKSRHGEEAPEPAAGDLQGVHLDSSSIRLLVQQLVRVRTTISSSPCDVSFSGVKRLCSDAEESLEHLHYNMILALLGVRKHLFLSSPPNKHGSRGLYGATLGIINSELLSLTSMVTRCILLCRGVLGIMSIFGPKSTNLTPELPVFAFDDLRYTSHNKVTRIERHGMPSLTDPIYLSPVFIRSLLYLDLSSCSSITELPPCIGNLHNLAALNLSRCYSLSTLPVSLGRLQNLLLLYLSSCHALRSLPVSLCELSKLRLLDLADCFSLRNLPDSLVNLGRLENLNLSDCKELKQLPQPFVNLQELKYLNLSGSHGIDLDAEYLCGLANLKYLTLSPLTNIQGFPDSFRELTSRLDRLRWWKKNRVHPQCNPEAAFLNSYRCYEQSIIDKLLSNNEDDISSEHTVNSICIVGESGMGKTELVRRIYCNQMVLETFNLRIWVYACDKKRLLVKIVQSTTSAYCSDAPIGVLEEIVIEELTGKRLLLVLDNSDSKSQYFWSYIRSLLNVCAKGSAFVVTTKSNEAANLVGAMQTSYLSPVSKEECFIIFKGHVLGGLDMKSYPHLESIGWKVVEKSGGNPVCVKALSGLLCHSEISLCEIDLLVDGTSSALRLCYDLLPTHLQHCFKYCSLFPKDHIFVKHHIIRLWMSQGFVFPGEGNQPEDTGLHYFDELVCRSFFQRSPFLNDQDDAFVMHELFHDLATFVSKDECFRCEEPFCILPENICHLSVVPTDFMAIAPAKEAKKLQSFLVVRSFPVVRILHSNDLYVKYEFLRALNLSYTDILELPSSVGNMKHLRLLALNNTKIKGLPFEIGQVGTLQTLELKDCFHLTDLPETTINLAKLRHLDVQKEPGNIKVSMPHGIGQLTDLQTLTEFNIGNNLSQCSVAELKNLNRLRGHVHITGLENIKTAVDASEADIVGKHFLEALTLEWSHSTEGMDDSLGQDIANKILENLQPRSNLQKLVIQNYPGNLFPLWMQYSYLSKVVSIRLDNCYSCSELPYLGDLPFLKSLFIHRMNSIESFSIESNFLAIEEKRPPRFPSLEALNLWEMYDLQFWVGTREGDFPRICRLSISRCHKLRNLPPLHSLVHLSVHCGSQLPSFSELPSLKSVQIEGFHKIQTISFPHQLTKLKKLEISDCKELSSIFAYSMSVSDLQVLRCPKLDLVGSSLDDHHMQKVDDERNSLTRRSMVLKTATYRDIQDENFKWEKHGENNIFVSNHTRSYYRCLHRNWTGCCAMRILQPSDTDPNMLSAMYIFEHNHEFHTEPHLLSVEHETTHKRKEYDVSSDEHISKRQQNFLAN